MENDFQTYYKSYGMHLTEPIRERERARECTQTLLSSKIVELKENIITARSVSPKSKYTKTYRNSNYVLASVHKLFAFSTVSRIL